MDGEGASGEVWVGVPREGGEGGAGGNGAHLVWASGSGFELRAGLLLGESLFTQWPCLGQINSKGHSEMVICGPI